VLLPLLLPVVLLLLVLLLLMLLLLVVMLLLVLLLLLLVLLLLVCNTGLPNHCTAAAWHSSSYNLPPSSSSSSATAAAWLSALCDSRRTTIARAVNRSMYAAKVSSQRPHRHRWTWAAAHLAGGCCCFGVSLVTCNCRLSSSSSTRQALLLLLARGYALPLLLYQCLLLPLLLLWRLAMLKHSLVQTLPRLLLLLPLLVLIGLACMGQHQGLLLLQLLLLAALKLQALFIGTLGWLLPQQCQTQLLLQQRLVLRPLLLCRCLWCCWLCCLLLLHMLCPCLLPCVLLCVLLHRSGRAATLPYRPAVAALHAGWLSVTGSPTSAAASTAKPHTAAAAAATTTTAAAAAVPGCGLKAWLWTQTSPRLQSTHACTCAERRAGLAAVEAAGCSNSAVAATPIAATSAEVLHWQCSRLARQVCLCCCNAVWQDRTTDGTAALLLLLAHVLLDV